MVFKKDWKKTKESKEKKAEPKMEETIKSTSPVHKAFYIEKEKGIWRLVVADIQDDKVISKNVQECDNKALSLENFKIKFAKAYYFGL